MKSKRVVLSGLCIILSTAAAPKRVVPIIAPPPPITTVTIPEPKERYGDWTVEHWIGTAYLAAVDGSNGGRFGTICSPNSCLAFFNPKIPCEHNGRYPALINAPSAAYGVSLVCEKFAGSYVYELPLEGAIADAMSIGGVLGISFPMEGGEFRVSRFSLTGSARATARAQFLSKSAANPPPNPVVPRS